MWFHFATPGRDKIGTRARGVTPKHSSMEMMGQPVRKFGAAHGVRGRRQRTGTDVEFALAGLGTTRGVHADEVVFYFAVDLRLN